jgi:uncharacterized PurR-regulated membrane protein YhhQ (DUF165 family)
MTAITVKTISTRRAVVGGLVVLAYAATIPLANWMITTFPDGWFVAPGLTAPAGVYAAGLALALRDGVHEAWGRWGAWAAITLGVLVSLAFTPANPAIPALVAASAAAFAFSELADFFVYARVKERSKPLAVLASGALGLVVDSALFLLIAFRSLDFMAGQVVGKVWMTLVAAGAVWVWRRYRRTQVTE